VGDTLMANIAVLMPIYNDSEPAAIVLRQLAQSIAPFGTASFLVVDDGSIPAIRCEDLGHPAGCRLSILTLRRNLGHQRAIATGLSHLAERLDVDAVLVMDADGQDRIEDVPVLLRAWCNSGGASVVFAARTRRSEILMFRLFYQIYRVLHWLLTGVPVKFGNFSVLPSRFVSRLVVSSELWNHYAASVVKTKLPYVSVPTMRGRRLAGKSHLHFVALVVHGLSALSVFSEVLGVRLLVASAVSLALMLATTATVLGAQALGLGAFPEWAVIGGVVLLGVGLLAVTACSLLAVVVLGRRSGADFIPARDCRLFVEAVHECSGPHS